jgi:hypothetical protein
VCGCSESSAHDNLTTVDFVQLPTFTEIVLCAFRHWRCDNPSFPSKLRTTLSLPLSQRHPMRFYLCGICYDTWLGSTHVPEHDDNGHYGCARVAGRAETERIARAAWSGASVALETSAAVSGTCSSGLTPTPSTCS